MKLKKTWILVGGISGLIVGWWMIFYLNDIKGFIPALGGMILLIFGNGKKI